MFHRQLGHTLAHLFHPRRSNNHRSRLLHPESYFYFACMIIGFALFVNNTWRISSELGSILGYSSQITTTTVIADTNAERAAAGLTQLTENPILATAARAKAADMFTEQYWAHTSPKGKQPWDFMKEADYRYTAAGENLARDFMETAAMMEAWMHSPTHKANIVNPNYREIGVAVVNGTLQGVETTLVVQMFGRPQTGVAAVPTEAAAQVTVQPIPETAEVVAEATTPAVLSERSVTQGSIAPKALIPPQDLFKAVAFSIIFLLIVTLLYDAYISEQKNTARMVGKNLAHIAFFATIALVIALWKGGVIN